MFRNLSLPEPQRQRADRVRDHARSPVIANGSVRDQPVSAADRR